MPSQDLYVETSQALAGIRSEGRVKSIGVSNFELTEADLKAISALNRDHRTGPDPNNL